MFQELKELVPDPGASFSTQLQDRYPLLRHYDVWGVIVGANWNTNAMAVWRTERKELDSQSPAAAEEDKTRGNCC